MEDGAMVRVTRPRKLYDTIVAKAPKHFLPKDIPWIYGIHQKMAGPRLGRHGNPAITLVQKHRTDMAIAEVIEIPRGSREKYDEVIAGAGLTGAKLAPGQPVHFAGPMEGGGWQSVNVWESQEACDRWEKVLAPARRKAGLPDVVPPTRVFTVHRLAT
jgi:hypothetical protein